MTDVDLDAFLSRLAELPLPGSVAPDPQRPISDYPRMPRGTCYMSSRTLAEIFPELQVVYGRVTWFVRDVGCTLDHAWNVTPAGVIVDSTLEPDPDAEQVTYWPNENVSPPLRG